MQDNIYYWTEKIFLTYLTVLCFMNRMLGRHPVFYIENKMDHFLKSIREIYRFLPACAASLLLLIM